MTAPKSSDEAETAQSTQVSAEESADERNARIHGRAGRVISAIESFNRELSREARREKYGKMAASAYALYRGTNHLFWMDFEWDWRAPSENSVGSKNPSK